MTLIQQLAQNIFDITYYKLYIKRRHDLYAQKGSMTKLYLYIFYEHIAPTLCVHVIYICSFA